MTAPADSQAVPRLFTPIQLRSVTAKNRIMVSPMCQYASRAGAPVDWHMAHLGRLAIGGAGIIFHEETAVEARGRKTYECSGLWDEGQVAGFRRLNELVTSLGAVPAIQLGHSGAKGSSHGATQGWRPLEPADAANGRAPWPAIGPSPGIFGRPNVAEMDLDDIRTVLDAWGETTERALNAGYRILEIHGAHGYLIHQFLSPVTNRRSDGYGGDLRGRMRFALEATERVRSVWPDDLPLFFRVSCVDGRGGIWGLADTIALARELKERGVDVVDCSSGGISSDSPMPVVPRMPGYHVPYARDVRAGAGVMTVAVGLMDDPRLAESTLLSGHADVVALGRAFLENGNWPLRAARELGLEDPYSVLPPDYAFRLRRRDQAMQLDINKWGAQVPVSISDFIDAN